MGPEGPAELPEAEFIGLRRKNGKDRGKEEVRRGEEMRGKELRGRRRGKRRKAN